MASTRLPTSGAAAAPSSQSYYQGNFKLQQFIGSKGVLTALRSTTATARKSTTRTRTSYWVQQLGYSTDNSGNWATRPPVRQRLQRPGWRRHTSSTASPPSSPTATGQPPVRLQGDLSETSRTTPKTSPTSPPVASAKIFLTYLNYKTALTSTPHLEDHHLWPQRQRRRPLVDPLPRQTYDPSTGNPRLAHLRAHLRVRHQPRRRPLLTRLGDRSQHPSKAASGTKKKASTSPGASTPPPSPAPPPFPSTTSPSQTPSTPSGPTTSPVTSSRSTSRTTFKISPVRHPRRRLQNQRNLHRPVTSPASTRASISAPRNPRQPPTPRAASPPANPSSPQFGVNWKLHNGNEVFGDVAENVRAFQAGGNGFGTSPWGTTQAGFNALTNGLKSESSWSEEAGFRHVDNNDPGPGQLLPRQLL